MAGIERQRREVMRPDRAEQGNKKAILADGIFLPSHNKKDIFGVSLTGFSPLVKATAKCTRQY